EAGAQSIIRHEGAGLTERLTWAGLPDAFQKQRWAAIDNFLGALSGAAAQSESGEGSSGAIISDALLELATLTDILRDEKASQQFDRIVLAAVDVSEPCLPRPEYKPVYTSLLSIWSERRCESGYPPDGHLLLALVDAVLTHEGGKKEAEA